MKKLYLIRHAKSDWSNSSLDDFDRPLNKRGKKDLLVMGDRLFKMGVVPDYIISSKAERAKNTAQKLASLVSYNVKNIDYNEELYMVPVDKIYSIIANLDGNKNTVFLVGHNPELTEFANTICENFIENIPTCGVYAMELICDNWKDISKKNTKFLSFEYPKKFKQLNS